MVHITLLTLRDPAPPGYVTVKTIQLDGPYNEVCDGLVPSSRLEQFHKDHRINNMDMLAAILPRERNDEDDEYDGKRDYILDDRSIGIVLARTWTGRIEVAHKEPWTSRKLGLLPRFHHDGKINVWEGHWGLPAWVNVDGRPRIIVANAHYALTGGLELENKTTRRSDNETLPTFMVTEDSFPPTYFKDEVPLDERLDIQYNEYIKLFVEPRSPAAARKAKMRKDAESRGEHFDDRISRYSPLQTLERYTIGLQALWHVILGFIGS